MQQGKPLLKQSNYVLHHAQKQGNKVACLRRATSPHSPLVNCTFRKHRKIPLRMLVRPKQVQRYTLQTCVEIFLFTAPGTDNLPRLGPTLVS